MLIYLAAPLRAVTSAGASDPEGVKANLARAKRWLAWVLQTYPNTHPTAPWIPCCEILDDSVAENRWRGMAANLEAISRCDAVWLVGGRVSEGMKHEAEFARSRGLAVFDFTGCGLEPPPVGTRAQAKSWP